MDLDIALSNFRGTLKNKFGSAVIQGQPEEQLRSPLVALLELATREDCKLFFRANIDSQLEVAQKEADRYELT
jgi:hypothetical protein